MTKNCYKLLRKIAAAEDGKKQAGVGRRPRTDKGQALFVNGLRNTNPYYRTFPESGHTAGRSLLSNVPYNQDSAGIITREQLDRARAEQATDFISDEQLFDTPFADIARKYLIERGKEHERQFKEGRRWPGMPLPKDTVPRPEGLPDPLWKKLEEYGRDMAYNTQGFDSSSIG